MLSFLQYLNEAKEASAKNAADSMGKLHEVLVGKHLSDGKHLEHHRDEKGLSPKEAHDAHATALFGKTFEKHPEYKKMDKDAKDVSEKLKSHLKTHHGINKIDRVAWTSQKSDHKTETGHDDHNSKADLIVTSGDHKKKDKKQVGVSLKVGKTKTPNYSNPGLSTYEKWSGTNLKKHVTSHGAVLDKHGKPSHEAYKAMRDGKSSKEKECSALDACVCFHGSTP